MPKEKKIKKFMEKSVKHPDHLKKYKNSKHHFLNNDRVHYGSGFSSDFHKSIKDAKKRINKPNVHKVHGGSEKFGRNESNLYRIF
jgi:hypothetical protein